jgi:23S rRNA (pseudouridine1915-N3)-methyltransferase
VPQFEIIAVGRLKSGPLHELYNDYITRMRDWQVTLHEIDDRKPAEPAILERLNQADFVFILDERGKALGSEDFAKKIQTLQDNGQARIAFVIGGADGHSNAVRSRADMLLSFGVQTWPHMLARVMLAEQLYRARQIIAGHPYHRQ